MEYYLLRNSKSWDL